MLTGKEAAELRAQLDLSQADFGRLVGVDTRTIVRWEAENSNPTGAPASIVTAVREKLAKDPAHAARVVGFLKSTVPMGGLPYLFLKLLDLVDDSSS